ncbi:MAG: DNA alkylation repair protein, partial [Pseudomonadota bacterium]
MPEPFKTFFNPDMIALMGTHLARASDTFDQGRFVGLATDNLDALELKERSRQIRDALQTCLPSGFRDACSILNAALHPEDDVDLSQTCMDEYGIRGWAVMPMTEFVAENGLDDFDYAMDILKEMTKRFSSEFAVRAFIARDQDKAMTIMTGWTEDANYHVRRLASEGSRPRLPWGGNLAMFISDPEPVIDLLEHLKDDPSDYVRRSVANSLNDIAKDHPDRVAEIAGIWLKHADGNRRRLVRHACRTLVKQGHKPTLDALGFGKPDVELIRFDITTPAV